MKRLALLCLSALTLSAQQVCNTAVFPGGVATDSNLLVAADNVQTVLIAPQAVTDTVLVVQSSAGWLPNMVATVGTVSAGAGVSLIEQEKVTAVNGNVLTVTRGLAGTTAAVHIQGSVVSAYIDACYHNSMKSEVEAIETQLANGPVFNVQAYGADSTGVNDSTAAINAASAAATAAGQGTVLLNPGRYKVTNALSFTGPHVVFTGPGAVILVSPAFNLTAPGVVVLYYQKDPSCAATSDLCPGVPALKDIYIRFQNADTTAYSSLIAFPPGIACGDYYGCDYAVMDHVKVTQAMTGIKISPSGVAPAWVSGNIYAPGQFASVSNITYLCTAPGCSGTTSPTQGGNWEFVEIGTQVRLDNIDISAFNYGIVLDGSDNEEMLSNYHFYPDDMTGNQGQIWGTHGTGLWTAGLYDLSISNYINSNFPVTIDLEYDPTYRQSCTFAVISGLMVDTAGGTSLVDCGLLTISGGNWNLGTPGGAYPSDQVASVSSSGTIIVSGGKISSAISTSVVNTSGTGVTWQSGPNFAGLSAGRAVWINGISYTIATWNSNTSITLTSSAGTQTGVTFSLETALFANNGVTSITGVTFVMGQGGSWQIVSNVSPGTLLFNDNTILNFSTGTTYLIPALYNHDGGTIHAVGNRFSPISSNSGTAILFDTGSGGDTANWIADNYFNGWGFVKPNVAVNGYYQQVPTGVGVPTITGCGTISNQGYSTVSQAGTFETSASSCTLAIGNLPPAHGYACTLTDTTAGTTEGNVGYTSTTATFNTLTGTTNHFLVYNCNPW